MFLAMNSAKARAVASLFLTFVLIGTASAQRDEDNGPTCNVKFLILKEDNGKPVRNAAVIMHPVDAHGKQGKGDLELKTDPDGKASFDDLPYGKILVQVLASGFQTFGENFDVAQPRILFTIKLKRPQKQYSIYDEHSNSSSTPSKQNPPPEPNGGKPN